MHPTVYIRNVCGYHYYTLQLGIRPIIQWVLLFRAWLLCGAQMWSCCKKNLEKKVTSWRRQIIAVFFQVVYIRALDSVNAEQGFKPRDGRVFFFFLLRTFFLLQQQKLLLLIAALEHTRRERPFENRLIAYVQQQPYCLTLLSYSTQQNTVRGVQHS